jgi:UDP-glucose 4-epimerase
MRPSDTSSKQTVLVTGGGGYIGSHTVKALQTSGYRVIILDNLIYGHRDLVEKVLKVELIEGDIGDRTLLDQIFSTYEIAAVIHFAAYAYVGESTSNPAKYYTNNVCGTLTLLQAMVGAGIDKLVFSSTCAIYGVPDRLPIAEAHPKDPINPYGRTKLIVEQMLDDFDSAYGLSSICFRYFNAAGADPSGELGEDHTPETHLIPLVLEAAANRRSAISIFGTDYPTADGTCVRDYIHVSDLARAHVLGLEHLLQSNPSQKINLSNGNGFSVSQVIETARAVTGCPIQVIEEARRAGDPPILIGSSQKALTLLGWEPRYPDLVDIITHAWQWHQKRHGTSQLAQEVLCSNASTHSA